MTGDAHYCYPKMRNNRQSQALVTKVIFIILTKVISWINKIEHKILQYDNRTIELTTIEIPLCGTNHTIEFRYMHSFLW